MKYGHDYGMQIPCNMVATILLIVPDHISLNCCNMRIQFIAPEFCSSDKALFVCIVIFCVCASMRFDFNHDSGSHTGPSINMQMV